MVEIETYLIRFDPEEKDVAKRAVQDYGGKIISCSGVIGILSADMQQINEARNLIEVYEIHKVWSFSDRSVKV